MPEGTQITNQEADLQMKDSRISKCGDSSWEYIPIRHINIMKAQH